jgi:hypothetical protein
MVSMATTPLIPFHNVGPIHGNYLQYCSINNNHNKLYFALVKLQIDEMFIWQTGNFS